MEKILNENNSENTVVYVVFRASDKEEYECAGVLMREEKDSIRVAFNAKNGKIKDWLDIKQTDIISINVLDSSVIEKL